jgi:hypothetical protein
MPEFGVMFDAPGHTMTSPGVLSRANWVLCHARRGRRVRFVPSGDFTSPRYQRPRALAQRPLMPQQPELPLEAAAVARQ